MYLQNLLQCFTCRGRCGVTEGSGGSHNYARQEQGKYSQLYHKKGRFIYATNYKEYHSQNRLICQQTSITVYLSPSITCNTELVPEIIYLCL